MIKNFLTILILFAISTISATVLAAPSLEQLRVLYPDNEQEQWAFTETISDDEGDRVERFQAGVWQLVSYQGGEPDDKARKRYADYLSDEQAQQERNNPVYFVGRMLRELDEIFVAEETGSQVVYEFSPEAVGDNEPDEMTQYLKARFFFDLSSNTIKSVLIENTESISPVPMAKISRLKFELTISDGQDGIPRGFLIRAHEQIEGRFMGFKKISQNNTISYSQYKKSGE